MGNFMRHSFAQLKVREDRDAISRTECHDFDVIKKIWQSIEKDSAYYGFAFCTVLFQNHPQYAKYFEEESIPEFVQEAKVKKKFTIIYDIVCALFIDYQDKPVQREYLLGYIAMVHKDMELTLKDFENFMSDLLETLTIELPHLMTEEYVLIQMKYLNDLTELLPNLMEQQRKRLEQIVNTSPAIKKCCAWRRDPQSQLIYGFPLRYWLYKKRYWEYRRAIWASVEVDSLVPIMPTSALNRGKMLSVRRKRLDVRRNERRRQSKTKPTDKYVSSDSETSTEPEEASRKNSRVIQRRRSSLLQDKILGKRRFQRVYRPHKSFSGFSPMETIQEDNKTAVRTSSSKMRDVSSGYTSTSKVPKVVTALHAPSLDSQTDAAKDGNAPSGDTARERRRESKMPYVRS